jgi:subtilisin
MLEDEAHCSAEGVQNYHKVLRAVKDTDPELYEFIVRNIPHKNWHAMVFDLQFQKPELYQKIEKLVQAMEDGQEKVRMSPERRVQDAAWELAHELKNSYVCDTGVVGELPPTKHTVSIHLKFPDPITGLPRDLMAMSSRLAKDHGGKRKWTFGFDNRIFVADLEDDAIAELLKSPLVEKVEFAPMARIYSNEIPAYNPAAVNTDWGVSRINPQFAWGQANYGRSVTGRRIKVCVIDTGIKSSHEAFWKDGVCVYKGGYNFVAGNANPADDHDHGTYCCSIVAAQHTGIIGSYRGVAPDIELYACKVLDSKGSGSLNNVAAGIDWARTNGMDICSLSLGGPSGTTVLQQACDAAWYAGLLVIVAAGNEGPGENTIGFPARYPSCMAVAAMDYDENIASFSSRGPESEVSAPGRYITGAFAGFTYTNYVVANSNNKYMCASGTSAACPHVAGGAALLKAWYPSLTNTEMRQWIRDRCRDL